MSVAVWKTAGRAEQLVRVNLRISSVSWQRFVTGLALLVPVMMIWVGFIGGNLRSFRVISASMVPALRVGDCVIMEREQGNADLRQRPIAFKSIEDPDEILTKRVIAAAGDRVTLRNGRLYVNRAPEPVRHDPIFNVSDREWKVGSGQVFVVGDNRNNSYDSVDYGPLPVQSIIGVLTFRYWPLHRIGRIV